MSAKPRRVKSAKARLTPTKSEAHSNPAREAQASARATRDKHNASGKVFPRPNSRSGAKERFSTMYSKDFDGTFAPPAELRPTSPTRRHNPHPGKVSTRFRPKFLVAAETLRGRALQPLPPSCGTSLFRAPMGVLISRVVIHARVVASWVGKGALLREVCPYGGVPLYIARNTHMLEL